MIQIENLNKSFGKTRALRDINLELHKEQCVAFVGPNGSGKTTLIKCLLGLVHPDTGQISVNQTSIQKHWEYREHIGYMPQIGRYPDQMTIRQVLALIRQIRPTDPNHDLDEELLENFGLTNILHQRMHTLSGGTRQKVSASIAFLFNPPILILDEPTAGLDPLANDILKTKIREQSQKGKLILISSHILSELDEIASHVLFIQDGDIRLFKPLRQLKEETNEERLSKAIASIMKKKKEHE